MFVGREVEMEILNRCYGSGKFEFITVYGRRRVGKTTLIREFCKGKRAIIFPAIEANAKDNLRLLSAAIYSFINPETKIIPTLGSFQDAFDLLAEMASKERIVFVIDEFPYLAHSDKSIISRLQNFIDSKLKDTKLMLILSGSVSLMEDQVHGYNSPLYGRRTAQIRLLPFRYNEIKKWFPNYRPEDLALVFGILGGVPSYLERFTEKKSISQNIQDAIMCTDAVLFEEPSNLMKQDLHEPRTYNSIIAAIAGGRTRLSEISDAVGIESGPLTGYIDNLISIGIVKKERPIMSDSNKKTIYLIADNFFRFWFRFVPQNMAGIVSGNMPVIFESAVLKHLPEYMKLVFEDICKEFLITNCNGLPFTISNIGQWWGADPVSKAKVRIDIVAYSHDSKEAIIGSCNFSSLPASEAVLNELRSCTGAIGGKSKKYHYYIFSKSGFTLSLINVANSDPSVRLITLDEIYSVKSDDLLLHELATIES